MSESGLPDVLQNGLGDDYIKDHHTKYEKARILSARALQISQGAPVLIDLPKNVTEPLEIAKLEWEAGVIPITIKEKREQPDSI